MTNNDSSAPLAHRPLILIACMLAMFMSAIEATIVATAMPTIIGDLGGFSLLGWVFAVYLLAQAITIPIYGRLADLLGRKRVFFFGASLFLLGSVLCGFSPNMYWLIGFGCCRAGRRGDYADCDHHYRRYLQCDRAAESHGLSVQRVGRVGNHRSAAGGVYRPAFALALVFWVNLPIGLLAMFFLRPLSAFPVNRCGNTRWIWRARRG
ncbi:Multidrug-efflux transporter 3 [Serratia plymuthica]|uniref:Multidrug-efflux transporter 3 n=1 Tax=Serratia plymuthica TaxID=82996 RepID=A0A2X4UL80_SERPL|nr:Multidrug-efflux transporter 3 [Serratia plymuthica]